MSDAIAATPEGRKIVGRFLDRWRRNPDVEGVLLFGSHADGAAAADSDVDLYVLLSPGARWDEPELRLVDGIPVEVFAGERAFFEQRFERFHADNTRVGQTQFATARVLFDRRGEAAAIVAAARRWLDKPRVRLIEPGQTYWPKRILFATIGRLRRCHARGGQEFAFAYHYFVQLAYATYARFLGQPVMEPDRLYRYLVHTSWRRRYLQDDFPDGAFVEALTRAVEATDTAEQARLAQALYDHVVAALGGLDVPEESTDDDAAGGEPKRSPEN